MSDHEDGKHIVEARDLAAWRAWLRENHSDSGPVWVTNSKKDGQVPAVSYADPRDEPIQSPISRFTRSGSST